LSEEIQIIIIIIIITTTTMRIGCRRAQKMVRIWLRRFKNTKVEI
jgi:hypothetical protein